MIPITLITGFLGSGKSSCLKALHRRYPQKRWVYLVNEFGAVDVDGQILAKDLESVIPLAGGSIFCTCLASECARVLKTLPERYPDIEGLVIEASGIANPTVVDQMIQDLGLDCHYRLASVIALVDPGTFPVLVQSLPNITTQVACADLLLLNKTDCYEEEALCATETQLTALNPQATLLRCVHGDAAFDPFEEDRSGQSQGDYARCIDPNYAKAGLRLRETQSLDALCAALNDLGASLYRAKGFIPTQKGAYYLDWTLNGIQRYVLEDYEGPFDLVLIGKGLEAKRLQDFCAMLKAGACRPAAKQDIARRPSRPL